MYIKSFGLIVVLIIVTLFIGISAFTFVYYAPQMKSKEMLLNYKDTGIVLTDRHNTPFYFINEASADTYVPLREISDSLQKAVISEEDEDFYFHNGISLKGIARSVFLNLKTQSLSYGGSTLTQQLVKNTLLSPDKNFIRKFQEAELALYLEKLYEKDDILEMYLNSVYYGEGAVGIHDASLTYFDKEPSELTIAESAFLAGILKSPSLLSPNSGDLEKGKEIQKKVLEKMREDGFISDAEYDKAVSEKLVFAGKGSNQYENTAPHFAIMVENELREMYGDDVVYKGITVKTTLDLSWQKDAQETVREFLSQRTSHDSINGSVVAMDPDTGEVLVLVGSKDWFNDEFGKVNMAIEPRQPGSTFKPIVYSLAFEDGVITPATILHDKKQTFADNYKPENYDRRYRGRVTVRQALANSLNVPSVEVMEKVGVNEVLNYAPEFGISSLEDASHYGPSLVLGTGEVSLLQMTNAYTTFANEGVRQDPIIILEVKNKYGDVIYKGHSSSERVIDKDTAFLITSILSDDSARQATFGNLLTTPFPTAVKTGTTENYRDAWTIGYTPNLTIGVWVGHNDNSPMYNSPGSTTAAPIWKALMGDFVNSSSVEQFAMPSGVVEASFCISGSSDSARMEYFIKGTAPKNTCDISDDENLAKQDEEHEEPDNDNEDSLSIGGIPPLTPTVTASPSPTTSPQ